MQYVFRVLAAAAVLLAGAPAASFAQNTQSAPRRPNVLEVRVTAPGRKVLSNVRVSLLSDVYSPLTTDFTSGGGVVRFQVQVGVYYVEVEPDALPYERTRQRVEVDPGPFSSGGEIFREEVQLQPLKQGSPAPIPSGNKVRFTQVVPPDAKTEYDKAMKSLEAKPDEAYAGLRKALQLFPDYYDAMETLGTAYVKADYTEYAVPILMHAIEINKDGEKSHYALGVAFFKLKQYELAGKYFQRALDINKDSLNAMVYLGLAQYKLGKKPEAEASLKGAYTAGAKNVAELHMTLAKIYTESNRPTEAANQLSLMLKEIPDTPDKDKIKALIAELRKKAKS